MRLLYALLLAACAGSAHASAPATAFETVEDVEAYAASEAHRNATYQERLTALEDMAEGLPPDVPVAVRAAVARHKIATLARLGDYEKAENYVRSVEPWLLDAARETDFYLDVLYPIGYVYISAGEIELGLQRIEEMKRSPQYETDVAYHQYADNLLVLLHTNIGNAVVAAEILIENFRDGTIEKLPTLDQLKLVANIGYALVEGAQYERAEKYLELGRRRLQTARDNGDVTDVQTMQMEWYLHANASKLLIEQARYNELREIVGRLTELAEKLGAPLLVARADFARAALAFGDGDYAEAEATMRSVIESARRINAAEYLPDFLEFQASVLAAQGKDRAALEHYLMGRDASNMSDEQKSRARADYVSARSALARRDAQIERLRAEREAVTKLRRRDGYIIALFLFALVTVSALALNLARSKRRLDAYARDLKKSELRALAATDAKSSFLANMSHEIRTPLNGLMGMAQVLSDKKLDHEQRQCVEVILESGDVLLTVVNDVLDLSKIEAGKMAIDRTPTDLREALDHLLRLWRPKAAEKGLVLSLETPAELPPRLEIDAVRLRQCVSNLVSNAIKFTDEGGVRVVVDATTDEPGQWSISIGVHDTGVGIPQEALDRLFSAFEQVDASTTRRYGGTGLGLAITSRLAGLMGGGVSVESAVNEGSVFTMRIVAAEATGVADAPDARAQPRDAGPAGPHRALLVDDNSINRLVAKAFLQEAKVDIVEAENGEEALRRLEDSGPFDLVYLDMHMPVMDGPETISRIRGAAAEWRGAPIIALPADAMEGDRDRYISMGADGYIAKPIVKAELQRETQRVMAARGRAAAA
ncbi:MAG: ATP-binding protein [Parvularculaceae bacterium]